MADIAILAEDLTYQYGTLTAVDHINFSVTKGEIRIFGAGMIARRTP